MWVPIGSPMGTPHCEKVRSPCGSSAKDIKDETIVGVWCQQQWTSREVSSLSLVRERMFAQCSSANSVHLPDISTCLTIFYPLLCFLLLLTHRVTYIQNNPRACKIRERMFIECSSASSVPPPRYFNLSSTSPPIFYTLKLLLKVTVGSVVKCVLEPYIGRVRQAKGGRQA